MVNLRKKISLLKIHKGLKDALEEAKKEGFKILRNNALEDEIVLINEHYGLILKKTTLEKTYLLKM